MQHLRLLLFPLSVVYGLIIRFRNFLYNAGVFSSQSFDLPIITIGNLAVGGAGKSPMAEYIIKLLKQNYKVAVLSRGYKRQTKGFRLVNVNDTAFDCGDEPLQFKRKFPGITVAVSEKRAIGIAALQRNVDIIVLDDAFQHRAVQAGLSILLFDYTRLHEPQIVFPAGNLREPFSSRRRADVLMASKCPDDLSEEEKRSVQRRLKPYHHQSLFFSALDYGNLISVHSAKESPLRIANNNTIFLLTGIANPGPLLKKLQSLNALVIHHDYPDHHNFSQKNIAKLVQDFKRNASSDKIIITTEKDAQRLNPALLELLKDLPVYYLPVMTKVLGPEEKKFNQLIESYVAKYIYNYPIH